MLNMNEEMGKLYELIGRQAGKIEVLESLVKELVSNQLLNIKIQARDAEMVSNRALEMVQEFIGGFNQPTDEGLPGEGKISKISIKGGRVSLGGGEDEAA